jgi:hypothetical protein
MLAARWPFQPIFSRRERCTYEVALTFGDAAPPEKRRGERLNIQGGPVVKRQLLGLIACMALFTGLGAAKADTVVLFKGTGEFSDGTTLAGTMKVDVTAGCVVGSAGCPAGGSGAPGAPSFTISLFPGQTFILGANPFFAGPNSYQLPLDLSPCTGCIGPDCIGFNFFNSRCSRPPWLQGWSNHRGPSARVQ